MDDRHYMWVSQCSLGLRLVPIFPTERGYVKNPSEPFFLALSLRWSPSTSSTFELFFYFGCSIVSQLCRLSFNFVSFCK